MNAQLKASLQNPWLAGSVLYGVALAFFAVAFLMMSKPLPSREAVSSMPWWAPIGGLLGGATVYGMLTMVDKVGAGPFNGLTMTTVLVTSLAMDHFGLLNLPVHALNIWRALGGFLMIAGVTLIASF